MKIQTSKGVRDFPPEEKIVRQQIVETLRNVFESYGYNPLETPVLERFDVLASKYAGGDEILKEIFKLKDQGGRKLGLIYDFTVPLSRFVAMNSNLKMPFKRYQIGQVFRDGPIKLGRYRQFWQCDVDVVGVKDMTADAEILVLTANAFKKLGMDIIIKVNNRKLLDGILEYYGVKEKDFETVILSIDKLEKLGLTYVKKELKIKKIKNEIINKILKTIKIKKINDFKKIIKNKIGKEGIQELGKLFSLLKAYNVKNYSFDSSLARGLSYYTGTVFEVYLKKSNIKSSVAAGGRYDKMISQFIGTKKEYPAIGISFGLDVIADATKIKKRKSVAEVYVIPIKTEKQAIKIVSKLRNNKINADIDLLGRGISKNLDYANSMGIPFVLFVGEKELKQKKVKLKNMKTGKEKLMSLDNVVKSLS